MHPLESEELIVTVSVIHVLSAQEAFAQFPAGIGPGGTIEIQKATEDGLQLALNRLLHQLEIQGG